MKKGKIGLIALAALLALMLAGCGDVFWPAPDRRPASDVVATVTSFFAEDDVDGLADDGSLGFFLTAGDMMSGYVANSFTWDEDSGDLLLGFRIRGGDDDGEGPVTVVIRVEGDGAQIGTIPLTFTGSGDTWNCTGSYVSDNP